MVNSLVSFLLWINIIAISAMDFREICQLPPITGNCKYSLNKWFFNSTSNQCETFIYSGCNGNGNRFPNKMNCEKNCIETVTKEDSSNETELPTAVAVYECKSPKDNGKKCDGSDVGSHQEKYRWYWSEENFACLSFKYNGCGGNSNNFESKEACMDFCQPQDGPACLGGQSVHPIGAQRHSRMIICPKGSISYMGAFFAECCNETIENDLKCPDGSKIMRMPSNYLALAENCDDLYCPRGFQCSQGAKFARCCPTKSSKEMVRINSKESDVKSPSNIPLI